MHFTKCIIHSIIGEKKVRMWKHDMHRSEQIRTIPRTRIWMLLIHVKVTPLLTDHCFLYSKTVDTTSYLCVLRVNLIFVLC